MLEQGKADDTVGTGLNITVVPDPELLTVDVEVTKVEVVGPLRPGLAVNVSTFWHRVIVRPASGLPQQGGS